LVTEVPREREDLVDPSDREDLLHQPLSPLMVAGPQGCRQVVLEQLKTSGSLDNMHRCVVLLE
jgi:hypothetical protein